MSKWNAIFKAGRHTDSNGVTRDFSIEDLDAMVAGYDPARHEAPLVIGHPKTDGPAWGWVEALKREGDRLMVKFREVPNQVSEMVRAGRFRKVSVALYPDKSLRHVGLLGAAPPAVKGLGSVQLAGGGDWASYEFTGPNSNLEGRGIDELERLKAELAVARTRADEAEGERDQAKAQKAEAEKAARAAEKEKSKKEAELTKAEAEQSAKDREARFNELVQGGKVLPGEAVYQVSYPGQAQQTVAVPAAGKWNHADCTLVKIHQLLRAMAKTLDQSGFGGQKAVHAGTDAFDALLTLIEGTDKPKVPVKITDAGSVRMGGFIVEEMSETWRNPKDGSTVNKLDPAQIRMVSMGFSAFFYGAVDDLEANLKALPMFIKPIEQKDPSGYMLVAESKPLPAVAPGATCKAVVIA